STCQVGTPLCRVVGRSEPVGNLPWPRGRGTPVTLEITLIYLRVQPEVGTSRAMPVPGDSEPFLSAIKGLALCGLSERGVHNLALGGDGDGPSLSCRWLARLHTPRWPSSRFDPSYRGLWSRVVFARER